MEKVQLLLAVVFIILLPEMVEILRCRPLVIHHVLKSKAFTIKTRITKTIHLKSTAQKITQKKSQKLITVAPSNLLDVSSKPTIFKKAYLQNSNGYFIQIPATTKGKVRGAASISDQYTLISMESVGKSIVRLRGVKSKAFLAMNKNGEPYISESLNRECLFKERLKKNGFHTFSSYKYSGLNSGNTDGEWYLAIKRNGKFKLAVNTNKSQRSTQFIVLPAPQ